MKRLHESPPPQPLGGPGSGGSANRPAPAPQAHSAPPPTASGGGARGPGPVAALQADPDEALARFASFDHVIDLIRARKNVTLLIEIEQTLKLARYAPGRIEFEPTPDARPDLAQRLGQHLQTWTGNRWTVTVVSTGGAPTIAEARDSQRRALEEEALAHPMVQAVLEAFPKATITDIRTPDQIAAEAAVEALPEVDDEWDPFEED